LKGIAAKKGVEYSEIEAFVLENAKVCIQAFCPIDSIGILCLNEFIHTPCIHSDDRMPSRALCSFFINPT